ncbi:hypothetical protein [Streptacidiphilus anmyonensis]|uniref:hypothetical protein n=1 Tax=Streptacidiphilus anmyonensis TaxID=405782 RepID=UPI0005A7DBC8|nr:hypothetical protein [Streptacidiphilus anmyonensis]
MVTPARAPDGWPDPFGGAMDVWPELWRSHPTLVFPSRPDHPTAFGWLPAEEASELDGAPRWRATLDDRLLTVTTPDGHPWYRGSLLCTHPWRRTARTRGELLLITGPFTHPTEFLSAAHSGHLLCAVADVLLLNCF